MKALVIDDSRAMRSILRKLLVAEGYQVTEAAHGREALERLRETDQVSLALVDWNMPEMNGLEFIHQVRANSDYDKMALIMVTTETEAEQMQRAFDAGADEYIMKPFTPEILRDKLELLSLAGA